MGKVLNCETVKALNINIAEEGTIPYVSRIAENNGVSNYYNNIENIVKRNCITIGAEGRYGFYQPNDFIPGVKIYTLRNKNLNKRNALFFVLY